MYKLRIWLTHFSQDKLHEAIVSLSLGKVQSNLRLGPYVHSGADGDEIIKVEKVALEDEGVKAEIAKLQLPEGTVVISDPWIYGTPLKHFARNKLLTSRRCGWRRKWPIQRCQAPIPMLPLSPRPQQLSRKG